MDGQPVRVPWMFPPHCSRTPRYFSQAVSTPANRQIFVNNILSVYQQYDLDGIDIDWEYPGQLGEGNTERPDDTNNMLQFIQLLRQTLPLTAKISAAVQDAPFCGPDGHPIKDASSFAKLVDWIVVMNYDDFEGPYEFVTIFKY